jgi:hypothetical protein
VEYLVYLAVTVPCRGCCFLHEYPKELFYLARRFGNKRRGVVISVDLSADESRDHVAPHYTNIGGVGIRREELHEAGGGRKEADVE